MENKSQRPQGSLKLCLWSFKKPVLKLECQERGLKPLCLTEFLTHRFLITFLFPSAQKHQTRSLGLCVCDVYDLSIHG